MRCGCGYGSMNGIDYHSISQTMISGMILWSLTFLSIETMFASLVHVECVLSLVFFPFPIPILTILALTAIINLLTNTQVQKSWMTNITTIAVTIMADWNHLPSSELTAPLTALSTTKPRRARKPIEMADRTKKMALSLRQYSMK